MSARVKFDVGGQIYSISLAALQNGPSSKLTQMYSSGRNVSESGHHEIDRPADMFASVLALYQTGELHFPVTSCPGAFLSELEFWEIAPEVVASCCYERLQSFVEEQEIIKKFRESRAECQKRSRYSDNFAKTFRGKLWNIIDYSKPSVLGKIYFGISLTMVLLSILTLAFSTDPYFRRKMTNCERLEYMESSGMDNIDLAKKWLLRHCDNEVFPNRRPPSHLKRPKLEDNACNAQTVSRFEKFKTVYLYYDNVFEHENNTDKTNSTLNGLDTTEKVESYTRANYSRAPELSTAPSGDHGRKNSGMFVKLPVFEIQIYAFAMIDTVTVIYFTIDVLLRFILCPSRTYYFLSIVNLIDVLALASTFVHIVLMQAFKHEKYRDNWMDVLKYFQVLRSLRLFRTVSNVRAGQVLAYTVRKNFNDILVVVFFLVVGVTTFASCVFVAEEREDIQSIPVGWYWALVTMTTVGYGDITPKSAVGRVIACLCAFAGIILLALTVPIFSNDFLTLYKFASSEKALRKYKSSNVVKSEKHEQHRCTGSGEEIGFT